jgi:hypothetical protein
MIPPSGVVVQVSNVPEESSQDTRRRRVTSPARDNSTASLRQNWVSTEQLSQRAGVDSFLGDVTERSMYVTGKEMASPIIANDRTFIIRQASEVQERVLRSDTPMRSQDTPMRGRYQHVKGNGVHAAVNGSYTEKPAFGTSSFVASYEGEAGEILKGLQHRMQVLSAQAPVTGRRVSNEVPRPARAVSTDFSAT